MSAAERLRGRALTAEAAVLLGAARILVAAVAFRRWRAMLGKPVPAEPRNPALQLERNRDARRLVRAVNRAARRLPGESRCLPQAMALSWMLRRRGVACTVVLGVLPGSRRGEVDDLHAWVICGGEIVIGRSDDDHRPLIAFAGAKEDLFSSGTR